MTPPPAEALTCHSRCAGYLRKPAWLLLVSCAGSMTALYTGAASNQAVVFYLGLCALIATLGVGAGAAWRKRIRALPQLGLLLLGIAIAFGSVELAWTIHDVARSVPGVSESDLQLYDAAKADPAGFQRWWKLHLRRWAQLDSDLIGPDPRGVNPYVLVPGSVGQRGAARVEINRLGFRGAAIAPEKGDAYRIVAIGESTTFGVTVNADDRTWPVALQEKIAHELDCDRPIEVINAGVPGWTLANQIARLHPDVATLEPDLLIAYHGVNNFHFFLKDVAGLHFAKFGPMLSRPSRILEIVERELRTRRVLAAQPRVTDRSIGGTNFQVELKAYAELFAKLVEEGHSFGTDVALCTFNLALDEKSSEDVIQFFEALYPDVRSLIIANRLNTRIVHRVAEARGAIAIDTSAGLDGSYQDAYVDLVHFTQSGRERLAENVFEGLRTFLRDHPRLRCRERSRTAGPGPI